MTDPTPIRQHRRYSKARKAEVVGVAAVEGVTEAERQTGVPKETIQGWINRPEFAQMRTEKHEEVVATVWAAFQLGVNRIVELIPQTDDLSKVSVATGIIYDKLALMSGQATSRSESLTGDVDSRAKAKDVLQRATREMAG